MFTTTTEITSYSYRGFSFANKVNPNLLRSKRSKVTFPEKQKNLSYESSTCSQDLGSLYHEWMDMKVNRRLVNNRSVVSSSRYVLFERAREYYSLSLYFNCKSLFKAEKSQDPLLCHDDDTFEHRFETQLVLQESSGHQTEEGTVESGNLDSVVNPSNRVKNASKLVCVSI